MRNFIVTNEAGGQFSRAYRITLENPLNGNRSATCSMQKITVTKDGAWEDKEDGLLVIDVPKTSEERAEVVPIIGLDGKVLGETTRGARFDLVMVHLNSEMVRADQIADKPKVILHDPA